MTPLSGAVNSAGAALEKLLVDPAGSRLTLGVPGRAAARGNRSDRQNPPRLGQPVQAPRLHPDAWSGRGRARMRAGHGQDPRPRQRGRPRGRPGAVLAARRIRPARSVTACSTAGSGQSSRSWPTRSRPGDDGAVQDAAHSPSSTLRPPPSTKWHSTSQSPTSGPHGGPKETAWFRHPTEGRAGVQGALSLRLAGRPLLGEPTSDRQQVAEAAPSTSRSRWSRQASWAGRGGAERSSRYGWAGPNAIQRGAGKGNRWCTGSAATTTGCPTFLTACG